MLSISRIARLNVYSLSRSCCRATASRARRLASADRRLATSAVVRKLNRATQFCGSAIVNLPTGGKKKKLKASVAAIEAHADFDESPGARDQQDEDEIREPNGRGIDRENAIGDDGNGDHTDDRSD